jgi:hypothetical protein
VKKTLRNVKKPALALRIEHIRTLTTAELGTAVGGVAPNTTRPSGNVTCTCGTNKEIECA